MLASSLLAEKLLRLLKHMNKTQFTLGSQTDEEEDVNDVNSNANNTNTHLLFAVCCGLWEKSDCRQPRT